jgi:hypothetical protein
VICTTGEGATGHDVAALGERPAWSSTPAAAAAAGPAVRDGPGVAHAGSRVERQEG